MEEIQLNVQQRSQVGTRKIKSVRRNGFIPAVVYGEKKSPISIKVERSDYERVMRQHRGQSLIFRIHVMEEGKELGDYSAIIKEEQHNPVSEELVHIDFNRISLTKEIEVKVAIATKGDPIGVKRDGGSLDHALWELDIICLPMNIPQAIEIDVSALEIGDAIHVKDIVLPQGVRTRHDPASILVSVVPPMKEEVEVSAEGAPTEPEVLKEKKKEEAPGEAKAEEKKEPKAEGKAKE